MDSRCLPKDFFEDILSEELIQPYEKVSVFIDCWGVITYTKTPHLVLKKSIRNRSYF